MNLHSRWHILSLLILLVNTVPVSAQTSFLDQLRLPVELPDYDDTQSLESSGVAPELNEDAFKEEPSFDLHQGDAAAPTSRDEADDFSVDALSDSETADDESPTGRTLLDKAMSLTGFEADHAPLLNNSEVPLVRYRSTSFQGAQAAYGFIPLSGSNGLGIQTLDLLGTFAVPIDGMDHVITFTPFFRMDDLSGNASLDVPDAVYETGVKSFWKKAMNERLTTMVLFTPSIRSDFESTEGAFKLFGMALLQWKLIPDRLSMTGGAMYTGRQDYPVLPTMGLLWTPSPVWRLDIQFPSPRFSRRILKDDDKSETWAYLGGVFGGNTWAVKRASGQDDQLTLRDLRLVMGVEHLLPENRGVFAETGWVFSRSMEYESLPGQIDLGDAVMLRAGLQF